MSVVENLALMCDCTKPGHTILFRYRTWKYKKKIRKELLVFTQLSSVGGILHRLKVAFKYVFNMSMSGDEAWQDTYLTEKSIKELSMFLNKISESDKC